MKTIRALALLSAAVLLFGKSAAAQSFETTVSMNMPIPGLNFVQVNSTMELAWFTQQAGGRTVYSNDVVVATMTHGTGVIEAHATWVINYNPTSRTVNLNAGSTHITNWWGNQRCQVYENGTCNCHGNANWNVCNDPQLALYQTFLVAAATGAALNAQSALTAAGYTVTRN